MTTLRFHQTMEENAYRRFPGSVEPETNYLRVDIPQDGFNVRAFLHPDLRQAGSVSIGFWNKPPAGHHINLAAPGSANAERNEEIATVTVSKDGRIHVQNMSESTLNVRGWIDHIPDHGQGPLPPGESLELDRVQHVEIPNQAEGRRTPRPVELSAGNVGRYHDWLDEIAASRKLGTAGMKKLDRVWAKDQEGYFRAWHTLVGKMRQKRNELYQVAREVRPAKGRAFMADVAKMVKRRRT